MVCPLTADGGNDLHTWRINVSREEWLIVATVEIICGVAVIICLLHDAIYSSKS